MNSSTRTVSACAGGAGTVAAACAALCCAGAPIIVSALAATGLGFLRTDAILLPAILIALVVALSGFWTGRALHGSSGPLLLGLAGSVALVAGVVFLHGPVAKLCIGAGAVALLGAAGWNAFQPSPCNPTGKFGRRTADSQ